MQKIFIALMALLLAVPLFAEDRPLVRLGGGYSYLLTPDLGDLDDLPRMDVTKGGVSYGAQALFGRVFNMEKYWWGIEAGYTRSFDADSSLINANAKLDSIPVLLLSEYRFTPDASVVPFVQGAAGVTFNSLKSELGGLSDTKDSTDFTLMVGPGLSFRVSERVSIDAIAKYYLIMNDTEDVTGDDAYTRLFNLTLNAAYRF